MSKAPATTSHLNEGANDRAKNAILLSCEACTKRKVRCDKRQPCAACVKSGRECVPVVSGRLPRGRRGGRKKDNPGLRDRLARLEGLVQSLSGSGSPPVATDQSTSASLQGAGGNDNESTQLPYSEATYIDTSTQSQLTNHSDINRLLGSTVWSQLCNELNGLRLVIEASDEEDDCYSPRTADTPSSTSTRVSNPSLIFDAHPELNSVELPSSAVEHVMTIFAYNVDKVVKVLHFPTFESSVCSKGAYLGHSPNSVAFLALKSAAFYASFCSSSEEQCLSYFGEKKEILVDRWQIATEHFLRKADITRNHNIVILQAMILYTVSVRTHDNGSHAWSLIGLAVRISQTLQLHRESAYSSLSLFQAQLHRRAWISLLALDYQASHDRGSDLMVAANGYNTELPWHVDDAEFGPRTETVPSEGSRFTDMTFVMIKAESQSLIRRLGFVSAGDMDQPPTLIQYSWQARWDSVKALEERIDNAYLRHCDPSEPLQYVALLLAKSIFAALKLYVVRPFQRHPALSPPPVGAIDILTLAIEALELREVFMGGPTQPWLWIFDEHVDWHPLSILLAELCSAQKDPQLVQRAWRVADISFPRVASTVAEGTKGGLWVPLRKLMKMAQSRRAPACPQSVLSSALETADVSNSYLDPSDSRNLTPTAFGMVFLGDAQLQAAQMSEPQPAPVPLDTSYQLDLADSSWLNWQYFTDNMVPTGDCFWNLDSAPDMLPFQSDDGSGKWPDSF